MPNDEADVLYLWEAVTSDAPESDRLGWLAANTEIPFRELDWARRIRNRIAHPDGTVLDPDDAARAVEILSEALDQIMGVDAPVERPAGGGFDRTDPDPRWNSRAADDAELTGWWARGPRPVRQFRAVVHRLLSKADPLLDHLERVRRPLQIVVPILLGLAVLGIAVDIVGGRSALDRPLTYLWLVLVLALMALAILFLPEILGVFLIGTLVYGLFTGNWWALLQVGIWTVVLGAAGGLLSWLYDLN